MKKALLPGIPWASHGSGACASEGSVFLSASGSILVSAEALPDLTYQALRALWLKHHNPCWLFPSAVGSVDQIRNATTHMDRGGAQDAMKAVVEQCGIKKKSPFTP